MSSTFHGLEVARRALSTQQSALYTTGHNIANANTEGYTRQRVNFEATAPFPPASRNRPEIPGQVGSGVQAGSVERVREEFLDVQFRGENAKLGYYEAKSSAMQQMETIMNEPSEQGLAKTMDRFWQSLQDLSVNPEDAGARSVVRQRAVAVSETFNYLSGSLQNVRTDLRNEMNVTKTDVNSLLQQINNVNKQIGGIEPNGYLPNDLYDERDRLIDNLSGIMDVNVSYSPSGGNANAMAAGKATLKLAGTDITLVDGEQRKAQQLHIGFNSEQNVNTLTFFDPANTAAYTTDAETGEKIPIADYGENSTISAENFQTQGKLKALIESNGYVENGNAAGTFPQMLNDLDKMASAFADKFNSVHQSGADLNGDAGGSFFDTGGTEAGAAAAIEVNSNILGNTDLIAAGGFDNNDESLGVGNGDNARALAEAMDATDVDLGTNTSVKSYYEAVIGEMAVTTQETNRLQSNAGVLRQQVEENRQSVSGVSLDEEMTNMIKFQHAYNAAARNMTAVDEMLDRIINNMGLVGR